VKTDVEHRGCLFLESREIHLGDVVLWKWGGYKKSIQQRAVRFYVEKLVCGSSLLNTV
jgi:hypothetical protein